MKRALVTGSTGGIGGEIAQLLCQRGWSLILMNRNQTKGEAQAKALEEQYPGLEILPVHGDFMDLHIIRAACNTLVKQNLKIDALLSISGLLTAEKVMSKQGFESHYAVNTLATYDLIRHATPLLSRSKDEDPAMVLTMSSSTIHRVKRLALNELSNPDKVGGLAGA